MPLHSRTHSHGQPGQDNPTSSAAANHPPSSLVEAAQTLSSIAAPNLRLQTASSTAISGDNYQTPIHSNASSTSLQQSRQHQQHQQHQHQVYQSPQDIYPPHRPLDPQQLQQIGALPSPASGPQYAAYQQPQQHQSGHSASASQTYLPYPGTSSSGRPTVQSGLSTESIPTSRTMSTHSSQRSSQIGQGYTSGDNTPSMSSSSASKYAPSSSILGSNTSSNLEKKYNHPNALPSYSSANTNPLDPYSGSVGSQNGRYLAPWGIFAVDWCKWPVAQGGNGLGGYGRVAVGSYSEDSHNCIQILSTSPMQSHSGRGQEQPSIEFTKLAEATHTYPITRILWEPPTPSKPFTDLLATSGDHLRLWSLPNTNAASAPNPSNSINRSSSMHVSTQKLTPLALLSNSKSSDSTAPLTSLDWNQISPALIITSSIDTTCTVWDIPTLTAKTQLIAHDKEVYDVRFMSNSVDIFASCGADGSVRMFDLRSLEHSTIIYEPSAGKGGSGEQGASPTGQSPSAGTLHTPPPLLRLAASPHDQHLIATFSQDSPIVRILDVRQPGQALIELRGHSNNVNCIEWAPNRRGHIAAGGDDCLVLVWDLLNSSTKISLGAGTGATAGTGPAQPPPPQIQGQQESHARTPVMVWRSDWEVNNISWSPPTQSGGGGAGTGPSEWLGVVGGRGIWGVKV